MSAKGRPWNAGNVRMDSEAQMNACFNCTLAECINCHCNRKVSFTCTCRADAEHNRIILDQIDIFFLTQCFRLYRLSLTGDANTIT